MSYQNYFKERIVDNNPTIEKLAELSTLFKRNSTIHSEFGLRNFAQFTNKEEISQQKLKLSQTHNSDSFRSIIEIPMETLYKLLWMLKTNF